MNYESYSEWKSWDETSTLKEWQARYFEKELKQANLSKMTSALEIGFGAGEFLLWASRRGVKAVGVEMLPELVDLASKKGFEVYQWNCADSKTTDAPFGDQKFDCIVAFDVFEHIPPDTFRMAIRNLSNLLNPTGKLILRFPNGESPFSLPLYNGDDTHQLTLTKSKLIQFCVGTPLELESYRNSARVVAKGKLAFFKRLLFYVRDMFELIVGYVYFGQRKPLDPAATAVLQLKS